MKQVELKFLLAALFSLVVATNCSLDDAQRDKPITEIIKDGIVLRLSTDSQAYQPGEIIVVNVSVENTTSTPISYTMWNIGDPAIYVAVDETPYSSGVGLYEKDKKDTGILPAVTADTLSPGQNLAREVVWDQLLPTYPDALQAPSGKYIVQAVFHIGAYSSDNEPFPLTARVEVEITGTAAIITPENAVGHALELPEVKQWYDAHSGANLIKLENGDYYVWFEMGWQKVSPSITMNGLTLDQFKTYTPDTEVLMTNNKWQVRLFTSFGPPPHELRIEVDPNVGTAIIMQEK